MLTEKNEALAEWQWDKINQIKNSQHLCLDASNEATC